MRAYGEFVEAVSPEMVGHRVSVEYIRDPRMVCGQFFGTWFNVNLSMHDVSDWQANLELMLHELSHKVVDQTIICTTLFMKPSDDLGPRWQDLSPVDPILVGT